MGLQKLNDVTFISKPNIDSLNKACKTLEMLGAIDKESRLTSIGEKMALLPIDPIFSKEFFY